MMANMSGLFFISETRSVHLYGAEAWTDVLYMEVEEDLAQVQRRGEF